MIAYPVSSFAVILTPVSDQKGRPLDMTDGWICNASHVYCAMSIVGGTCLSQNVPVDSRSGLLAQRTWEAHQVVGQWELWTMSILQNIELIISDPISL